MADATIGALRFVLGADTAELEAASGKASAAMRAAARAGEIAGQHITAAFTRMAGALAGALAVDRLIQFAGQSLELASTIRRMSDMAGLTTTQFQELQFALRETGIQGEQMGAAFGAFSRNLSDLQRGTGPLLDFLRQSAPQFISQFQRVRDVNEAFTVLAGILSRARNTHDGLRLAQAAGGEQMARLAQEAARLGTSLDRARQEAHEAGHVLGETQVEQLRKAHQAWTDFGNWVVIQSGRILAAIQSIGTAPAPDVSAIVANISRLEGIISRLTEGTAMWRQRVAELRAEQEKLNNAIGAALALSTTVTPEPGADAWTAQRNAVKALQGELSLYMARLQQMPQTMEFVSSAYAAAWERMRAVMVASGETAASIEAARLNLLMQQEQARLTGMQSLGLTLSIEEQYQQSLRLSNSLMERGIITAEERARANQLAALRSAGAWASAAQNIAGTLAGAFSENKAFAVANVIISTAAGIMKALEIQGPLGWAQAAAIAAAGVAQLSKINSTQMGSGASAPSVSGGGATDPAQAAPSQSFTVNLSGDRRYTHEEVAAIIEGINERVGNGVTLIATKVAA